MVYSVLKGVNLKYIFNVGGFICRWSGFGRWLLMGVKTGW